MNIKYISFEDHAYLDTIAKIGRKNLESLERMFNRHGPRRFQAAFLDTYKKVCIEDDGRLDNKKICDKFMCKMRERVREYSKESSLKVLSNTAEHVINRIGGTYAEEINDLLQQILIAFVRKGFGERKIKNEFQKIQEIADNAESYNFWAVKTSGRAA